MHSVILVALLPLPIKDRNIPQKWLNEQWQTNQEVLNDRHCRVVNSLTVKQNPSAEFGYYNILCADGNFSCCKLVISAWIADCPEYSNQYHLERHVFFWCECPNNQLGDQVPTNKRHPQLDHNLYRMLSDANTKAADARLSSCHLHREFKVFRHSLCIMSDLPKPDLPRTMQIGMLDHLQKWMFHFVKMHERLDKYNAFWLSVPAYHDLTPTNKSYEKVSQWNGKEMKEMSRYLLGVLTQSPRGESPAQHPIVNPGIECTQALLVFLYLCPI